MILVKRPGLQPGSKPISPNCTLITQSITTAIEINTISHLHLAPRGSVKNPQAVSLRDDVKMELAQELDRQLLASLAARSPIGEHRRTLPTET